MSDEEETQVSLMEVPWREDVVPGMMARHIVCNEGEDLGFIEVAAPIDETGMGSVCLTDAVDRLESDPQPIFRFIPVIAGEENSPDNWNPRTWGEDGVPILVEIAETQLCVVPFVFYVFIKRQRIEGGWLFHQCVDPRGYEEDEERDDVLFQAREVHPDPGPPEEVPRGEDEECLDPRPDPRQFEHTYNEPENRPDGVQIYREDGTDASAGMGPTMQAFREMVRHAELTFDGEHGSPRQLYAQERQRANNRIYNRLYVSSDLSNEGPPEQPEAASAPVEEDAETPESVSAQTQSDGFTEFLGKWVQRTRGG